MIEQEKWRVVDECPLYEVSSLGHVRRCVGGQGAIQGKVLKWHTNTSSGYPTVRLVSDGIARARTVHKLVAHAFLGPKPPGMQTRHLDGNKLNNAASNLRYGTHSENAVDKERHGTGIAGERNPRAKLTAEQAETIRADYAIGFKAKYLARVNAISESTVYRIVAGVYWDNRAEGRATQ